MAGTEQRNTGIKGGVGLTALMVAAARAIETHRADALARDVYAEHFVRAAPASASWPVRPQEVPQGEANPLWGRLARYFALRTRVFDDVLLSAARAGARQVVLLGAGLDSRAYRLDWPAGCSVYEIDSEEVLTFKRGVLGGMGAAPRATRIPVAADLRTDWAAALIGAGFDPATASTWLAEGLLLYLPPAAERRLIATVDRLTAGGGTYSCEVKLSRDDNPLYPSTKAQIGVDLLALFDPDPRPDSAGDLTDRGWSTSVRTPFEFSRHHGRGPLPEPNDSLAGNRWVFAAKPPSGRR
ncbi:SAM-dependent methyltransferase [Streptomyces polygonati]|uniref:S-adenosyl-L-methionine-dependent methyltransferase n=1 Tax=Streptomyces polygonati TaxID=1617087 RepID=A0ABV8HUI5_9ACTN